MMMRGRGQQQQSPGFGFGGDFYRNLAAQVAARRAQMQGGGPAGMRPGMMHPAAQPGVAAAAPEAAPQMFRRPMPEGVGGMPVQGFVPPQGAAQAQAPQKPEGARDFAPGWTARLGNAFAPR